MTLAEHQETPGAAPAPQPPSGASSSHRLAAQDAQTPEVRPVPGKDKVRVPAPRRTRRRRIILALLCVPALLCLLYWLFGYVAFADAARLVAMKGMVQTRREKDDLWSPGELNQLLWREQRIRTGDGSGARLLFFDVSSVDLAEGTEVSIIQVAKRRGGQAIDVVLKAWIGKTAVRAVRFVDPSSSFRVETPTASTVVRGARFTVEVAEDGTTQIDLQEGNAEVHIKGQQAVTLDMGKRIILEPDGEYKTEQLFEPNTAPVFAKVTTSWNTPDDALRFELTEAEVNQFLAAMSDQPDFFLRDTQVWFLPNEARIAATLVQPTRLDLSASLGVQVVRGRIEPQVKSIAAGVALPVPRPVLDLAIEALLGRMENYLAQAYDFVEFDQVRIEDGSVLITGRKRPDAPLAQ